MMRSNSIFMDSIVDGVHLLTLMLSEAFVLAKFLVHNVKMLNFIVNHSNFVNYLERR